MRLERFNQVKNREELIYLFCDYFAEMHGEDFVGNEVVANKMLQDMYLQNKSIYYVQNDDNRIIGFIVVYINDQYGMTTPTIVNDYMYVMPEYRSGKAVMMLYAMIGTICEENNMDCISSTFVQSANTKNNVLVGGEPIMTTNIFRLEKFRDRLNKYQRRIING